jgi:hypothetical protein
MVYLAFIFALALTCIAGIEFISLMALEAKNRQLQRRVAELERENFKLAELLKNAEEEQPHEKEEEAWPELINDERFR